LTLKLLTTIIYGYDDKMLQDKLLAKMDNEEEEKMPYSADDQVITISDYYSLILKQRITSTVPHCRLPTPRDRRRQRHRRRSSVNFRGQDNFARKICLKN